METNNILIKNGTVLNPLPDGEINYSKSSILIENNEIIDISDDLSDSGADKIIDADNKIVMPGLINTHTHLPMTLFRSLADDLELDSWLNDYIWPMEANLNEKYSYAGAMLGAVEMIKSGTTTFSDMYFYMDQVARAVKDTGIRGVLSYGMIDFGDSEKRENEFKSNIDLIKDFNGYADGRVTTRFGPHSIYTTSPELIERVRREADKYNVGIHIHMNETRKEIDDCIELNGKRPFEYLDDLGMLGNDVLAAHCVWLSDNEIQLIKENNVKVSHNPCSNMKLASGAAPIGKLLNNNICVSLGTDGASSNNNLDLFEEMKFASLMQKLTTLNPKVLSANETLSMATINGAYALGLENEIGSIEVGKKADIILLDTNKPNFTPLGNSLSSNIVYSANGDNVDTTICDGKILMENRRLCFLDEQSIINNTKEAIEELLTLKNNNQN